MVGDIAFCLFRRTGLFYFLAEGKIQERRACHLGVIKVLQKHRLVNPYSLFIIYLDW